MFRTVVDGKWGDCDEGCPGASKSLISTNLRNITIQWKLLNVIIHLLWSDFKDCIRYMYYLIQLIDNVIIQLMWLKKPDPKVFTLSFFTVIQNQNYVIAFF